MNSFTDHRILRMGHTQTRHLDRNRGMQRTQRVYITTILINNSLHHMHHALAVVDSLVRAAVVLNLIQIFVILHIKAFEQDLVQICQLLVLVRGNDALQVAQRKDSLHRLLVVVEVYEGLLVVCVAE